MINQNGYPLVLEGANLPANMIPQYFPQIKPAENGSTTINYITITNNYGYNPNGQQMNQASPQPVYVEAREVPRDYVDYEPEYEESEEDGEDKINVQKLSINLTLIILLVIFSVGDIYAFLCLMNKFIECYLL